MSQAGATGSGGGGGVTSITGNDGTPLITGAVQITTGINPGTPFFSVSGQELILNQSDGAPQNVSWGGLNFGDEPLTLSSRNCAFGVSALEEPTDLSSASYNNAFGNNALSGLTTGGKNNAVGWRSLFQLLTGENNCAFGDNSGNAYTTSESANICIGASVTGVTGESNVLRIGASTNSASPTDINSCYIQGINGATVSAGSPTYGAVVIETSNSQLVAATTGISTSGYVLTSNGTSTPPTWQAGGGGGGLTSIAMAASNGTAVFTNTAGSVVMTTSDSQFNVGWGINCMNGAPYGAAQANTAFGRLALTSMTDTGTSTLNCAFGNGSMSSYTTDGDGNNCAFGTNTLGNYTGGATGQNTAFGSACLNGPVSGGFNCGFGGGQTGYAYSGAESSNILIGYRVPGVNGESNALRIGNATGTSDGNLASAYIQGIAGVTVASSAAVLIDTATGQLGTVPSAARYKENIEDMEDESEIIYKLRPVRYNLRAHPEYGVQTGLVADEVQRIAPRLVSINPKGEPESVAYHELPALILNELQKLSKRVAALEGR